MWESNEHSMCVHITRKGKNETNDVRATRTANTARTTNNQGQQRIRRGIKSEYIDLEKVNEIWESGKENVLRNLSICKKRKESISEGSKKRKESILEGSKKRNKDDIEGGESFNKKRKTDIFTPSKNKKKDISKDLSSIDNVDSDIEYI
ncbi:8949_t:CDS:2 [Dentiscutata erythropus]|uniref:8949_t:CDS:1 n=1 Tax=Dentiscutata erythropus TaxID=1348616 RepID=A0A9N9CVB2_9GLOM|nr:8949_t:CDS:2 [Dentiscutata erythropus]